METTEPKNYQPDELRDCDAGDIVGIMGDTLYPAMIIRKLDDAGYEGMILEKIGVTIPPNLACKPGEMYIIHGNQILTRLTNIALTVKEEGEEYHIDFDEDKLKSLGFDIPQL